MRVLVCVSALVPLLASASPAQNCGPFVVSTTATGGGCATSPTTPAALIVVLGPSTPGSCDIVFVVNASSLLSVQQLPSLLWLGVANPALNLAPLGFPGCTLLTSADVFLSLPPTGIPGQTSGTVPVAPNPVFVGATVYVQALATPIGLLGPYATLSNGIAVSL